MQKYKKISFVVVVLFIVTFLTTSASSNSPRIFDYYSYDEVHLQFSNLAKKYPDYVKLTYGEDEYLDGSPFKCGSSACKTVIMELTNFNTLTKDNATRPQVFFSGEIHGDERVGPNAMVEFARFLLETYSQTDTSSPYYGKPNAWINRLVDTRRIFISPITNALGYFQSTRTENGIDTNRDYSVDAQIGVECMRTITSRVVNELYRRKMFQLAITFHGGMQAIAYEWGTKAHHYDFVSPDDTAQQVLGASMSAFAGSYPRRPYPHSPMNEAVYPVHGGMEDWAYAGSWDQTSRTRQCQPTTYGGYPKERTSYTFDQLRVFNILVETSDNKIPYHTTFGTSEDLLLAEGKGDGHLPRNIRLALLLSDMVQPYVQWIFPSAKYSAQKLQSYSSIETCVPEPFDEPSRLVYPQSIQAPFIVSPDESSLKLVWDIGGASFVDNTHLIIGKWDDRIHTNEVGFGWSGAKLKKEFGSINIRSSYTTDKYTFTTMQSGMTRWSGGSWGTPDNTQALKGKDIKLHAQNQMNNLEIWPYQPRWVECIDVPSEPGDYFVMVRGIVDQEWKKLYREKIPVASPNLPPQSHFVNARTNSSWNATNAGYRIEGRLDWYSTPLRVKVVSKTIHSKTRSSNSIVENAKVEDAHSANAQEETVNKSSSSMLSSFVIFAVVLGIGSGTYWYRHQNAKKSINPSYMAVATTEVFDDDEQTIEDDFRDFA